jgi:hypothetical protein
VVFGPGPGFPAGDGGGVFRGIGGSPRVEVEIAAGEFLQQLEGAEADGEKRMIEKRDEVRSRRGFGVEDFGTDEFAVLGVRELGEHLGEGGEVEATTAETLEGFGGRGEFLGRLGGLVIRWVGGLSVWSGGRNCGSGNCWNCRRWESGGNVRCRRIGRCLGLGGGEEEGEGEEGGEKGGQDD